MSEMTFGVLLAAAIDVNYMCIESGGKEYEIHVSKDWERGMIVLTDGCVKFNVRWKDDGTDQLTLLNMKDAESVADAFQWIGANDHIDLAHRMDDNWDNFQDILWKHVDLRKES